MKKWGYLLIAIMLFVLTACNSTAKPQSGATSKSSDLTLDEVYKNAIDRQNELKSLSGSIKMDQTIGFGTGEESIEMTTKSDLKMDMVTDPVSMYMDGTMTMGEPTTEGDASMGMEMYMTKDGMYMFDSEANQWVKLPSEEFDAMMGQTANQVNTSEQLEQMKSFINDFTFEQSDDQYILTLDAASDKFTEYMLEQMQINQSLGLSEEDTQVLEKTKVDSLNYKIEIDKETFDITTMDMNVTFTMDLEGQPMKITTDMVSQFDNFNGVEEIKIPQEVIDKAIEVQY
ncbi:hypothetical protein H9636_07680 [Ureibacillus sp. Re31]|uniref:Lipoprotein n=1 Tax=Ureibacillus galli TaxID=2762222 RepID=A0ABR8XBC9_9BACL|nr:DUF6612 family protein [Ureibacillus galli]MBD8026532.1 hypothetical protein [Ureibacillus galli]